jgi:hypothetical protein
MGGFNLTTLALAALAGAAGFTGFPPGWSIINCAIAATLSGMALARGKFTGIDLTRTLKITLAALAANALVAAISFYAGSLLRGAYVAIGG